jgi:hypothetical protein
MIELNKNIILKYKIKKENQKIKKKSKKTQRE